MISASSDCIIVIVVTIIIKTKGRLSSDICIIFTLASHRPLPKCKYAIAYQSAKRSGTYQHFITLLRLAPNFRLFFFTGTEPIVGARTVHGYANLICMRHGKILPAQLSLQNSASARTI